MTRPVTVHRRASLDVHERPPGLATARYDVIALPPFGGAAQVTTADRCPRMADTRTGAPGDVAGTTRAVAAEAGPAPNALLAVTVNVYGLPLTRPVTVQLAPVVVQVAPPGEATTV